MYHLLILLVISVVYYTKNSDYYINQKRSFIYIFGLCILLISSFMIISPKGLYIDKKEELYIVLYLFVLFISCYQLNFPIKQI